jgi:hypothetical protein
MVIHHCEFYRNFLSFETFENENLAIVRSSIWHSFASLLAKSEAPYNDAPY